MFAAPVLTPLLHFLSGLRGASLSRAASAVQSLEAHVAEEIEASVAPLREEIVTLRAERAAIAAELTAIRTALRLPEPETPHRHGVRGPFAPGLSAALARLRADTATLLKDPIMNANDVTLLTRMATDLATISAGVRTQGEALTALATRVKALEDEHGVPEADTAPISQILATLEEAAPAVAQAAESAGQTAQAVQATATTEQAPVDQQSAA